jgi:hypothetical protein
MLGFDISWAAFNVRLPRERTDCCLTLWVMPLGCRGDDEQEVHAQGACLLLGDITDGLD